MTINTHVAGPMSQGRKVARIRQCLRGLVSIGLKDVNQETIRPFWVILPAELTQEMMNAWLSEVANLRGHEAGYRAMIAAAPQQEIK